MADSGPLPHNIRNAVIKGNCIDENEIISLIDSWLNPTNEHDEGDSPEKLCLHLEKGPNKKTVRPSQRVRKTLSYKERRVLGLYSVGKTSLKYEDLLPLHYLWLDYMRKYIDLQGVHKKNSRSNNINEYFQKLSFKLYRADYHGAIMEVIRSTCPLYVGTKGIVAMETKNCFALVGEDNITRKIPKSQCQFSFLIGKIQFKFFGKNLISRPADRSSKKIKTVYLPIL